jgi:hypothetical protein
MANLLTESLLIGAGFASKGTKRAGSFLEKESSKK